MEILKKLKHIFSKQSSLKGVSGFYSEEFIDNLMLSTSSESEFHSFVKFFEVEFLIEFDFKKLEKTNDFMFTNIYTNKKTADVKLPEHYKKTNVIKLTVINVEKLRTITLLLKDNLFKTYQAANSKFEFTDHVVKYISYKRGKNDYFENSKDDFELIRDNCLLYLNELSKISEYFAKLDSTELQNLNAVFITDIIDKKTLES